ncbi:MAG: Single-stranded nucleic acid binding R3H [Parcubacteria group bacterium GW2011_GWA2_51_10]|nr:MAG: Single-stranded nucleic acid binding R3H [Parcubacteria group bacterium GW2011_GWA2_51_10]
MDENAIRNILVELLSALDVSYKDIAVNTIAGQLVFSIETDDGRSLIGSHGDTIFAIDHLVKKIAEQKLAGLSPKEERANESSEESEPRDERMRFLIDVNDYRAKQIKDLETKALVMAERARSFQYDVELTPMSSYERLIVHTVLADSPNVKTESQGEGRNRRVVIKYAAS